MASCLFNQIGDGLNGMKGGIVENDDIAYLKLRNENPFDPFDEEIAIAVASKNHRSDKCAIFEASHQINAFSCATVSTLLRLTALAFGCPAIRVNLIAVHARFINPDALFFWDFCKFF